MWHLHHYPLCAFSRKTRLVMAEYRLDFDLISEKPWERREDFLAMNPAGLTPVLAHDEDERILSDSGAIFEYLTAQYSGDVSLLGETDLAAAEARRVAAWFDLKFQTEVTGYAFSEMVWKRFIEKGPPNGKIIRAANHNLKLHLEFIDYLFARRRWLAGDAFTIADIAAAAQISVIDYFGMIDWKAHEGAQDWYARIKSRPSMRALLADRIAGLKPAPHYDQLDF